MSNTKEEKPKYINTIGLELRLANLVGEFCVQPSREVFDPIDLKYALLSKYKANSTILYRNSGDFLSALKQLSVKLCQIDNDDPVVIYEEGDIYDIFDNMEEDEITPLQAALLGIALGYSAQELEGLRESSGVALPFTIKKAREEWENIVIAMNPGVELVLKTPKLNLKPVDQCLARFLNHDQYISFQKDIEPPSKNAGNAWLKARLLRDGLDSLEYIKEVTSHDLKDISKISERDKLIGISASNLLKTLAASYISNTDTGEGYGRQRQALRNLLCYKAGNDFFSEDKIEELLPDKVTGGTSLPASEWAKNAKPLVCMLKVLLGGASSGEIVPFLKFMCGAHLLKPHKEKVKPPVVYDTVSTPSVDSARLLKFQEMVEGQVAAIKKAKQDMEGCAHITAQLIATSLFNELININTTISYDGDRIRSNFGIAELLAGQVYNFKDRNNNSFMFRQLIELIENIRHGNPFDPGKFDKFGDDALDRIVARILLSRIRVTEKPDVLRIMNSSRNSPLIEFFSNESFSKKAEAEKEQRNQLEIGLL